MLTTAEAMVAVLAATPSLSSVRVAAADACGRVLRQGVRAERDQPPFDRVMMDGIAFAWSDYDDGQRRFPVQAMQAAGDEILLLNKGHCIEIMTGAAMPANSNCIVPVEHITVSGGAAEIEVGYEVARDKFLHARGSDYAKGAYLLRPGKRISPLDIAIIASCGETEVDVAADPLIHIVSTGNELVPAGMPIKPQQIRLSNGPAIKALLASHGYRRSEHTHVSDDVALLREHLALRLKEVDVLVLSGGVSMGQADFVPQVLAELGIERVFHKVSQRPGKPLWFGKGPDGQLVFALPGNPVSALVCGRQYLIPALARACGADETPPEFAALAAKIAFPSQLTCFQPVKLFSNAAGQTLAMPVKTNTSGDFASLSATDGYVELPSNQSEFAAGTPVLLRRWIAH